MLTMSSPSDPVTNVLVFDPVTGLLNNGVNLLPSGAVSPDRSKPKNAGFGVRHRISGAAQRPAAGQILVLEGDTESLITDH